MLRPLLNTTREANQAIREIRQERPDCVRNRWDPLAMDAPAPDNCGEKTELEHRGHVGGVPAPKSIQGYNTMTHLMSARGGMMTIDSRIPNGTVDRITHRAARGGSLIIHFKSDRRPTDQANCWMFSQNAGRWSRE